MVLSAHGNGGSALGSKASSHNSVHSNHQQSRFSNSMAASVIGKVFGYAFGLFNFFLFLLIALIGGSFFQRLSEKEKNDLAIGMIANTSKLSYLTAYQLGTDIGICRKSQSQVFTMNFSRHGMDFSFTTFAINELY